MDESYDADYSDLDEYLAEYVDDAMDPKVREVFEELLSHDPRLAEHVCCLKETRMHLCNLRCPCAPEGWRRNLRHVIAHERVEGSKRRVPYKLNPRLFATLCSLLFLIAAGLTLLDRDEATPDHVTAAPPSLLAPVAGSFAAPEVLIQPLPASIPLSRLPTANGNGPDLSSSRAVGAAVATHAPLFQLSTHRSPVDTGQTPTAPLYYAVQP